MGINIYDVGLLENQIEIIASENDGEIPEEMLQALVEAQTKSMEQIDKLCRYIRVLELGMDSCWIEESRIKEMREKADRRIKSIKKYLTPFVQNQGKKIHAGTFTLSTRKSESVEVIGEVPTEYATIKVSSIPDKVKIKEDIKAGKKIDFAEIVQKQNLQIK